MTAAPMLSPKWLYSGKEAMTRKRLVELRGLQGHRVNLALTDGSRIDGCDLISIGLGGRAKAWVFSNGTDRFVPVTDVVDFWQ
jgi:hypothetical protein